MKTYRDKNGFEVKPGENWNDEKSNDTMNYLTDPNRNMTKHVVDTLNKFEDPDLTAQELEDFKAPIKSRNL